MLFCAQQLLDYVVYVVVKIILAYSHSSLITTLNQSQIRFAMAAHAAEHSWTQGGQTQNRECHNTRMDCVSERYR